MPQDQSEVPAFLQRLGYDSCKGLFPAVCGGKTVSWGKAGAELLQAYTNRVELALPALLASCGFSVEECEAFRHLVSSAWQNKDEAASVLQDLLRLITSLIVCLKNPALNKKETLVSSKKASHGMRVRVLSGIHWRGNTRVRFSPLRPHAES